MENRPPTPVEVKRQLRKEVGFGCPVPGCTRTPILEFHHFDPPWHVRNHFEPEGMIALCRECHGEADNWPVAKVRAIKHSAERHKPVSGFFKSWKQPEILVRLGGNYAWGCEVLIKIGNDPMIRLSRNAETGDLELSFTLVDHRGTPIVIMEENGMDAWPENIHDLEVKVTKTSLTVWLAPKDIGLEIHFRRMTWAQLESALNKDRAKTRKAAKSLMADLPADLVDATNSPPADDKITEILKKWFDANATDGKVAILDFRKMAIYHRGVKTTIQHGVSHGDFHAMGCAFANNRGAVKLPAYEASGNGLYALSNGVARDERQEQSFDSQTFFNELVVVDGKTFKDCTFSNCHLIYKGGTVPQFSNCKCDNLWVFDEAAVRTLQWLHYLYHGFGDHARKVIDSLIDDIRKPIPNVEASSNKTPGARRDEDHPSATA